MNPSALLRSFRPKVRLFFETDHYQVKTAESSWELEEILKLRYQVFYREWLGRPAEGETRQGRPAEERLDLDRFDPMCDHLLIRDKRTRGVIGTYRMMSSTYAREFYSAEEFQLQALLALPGVKLELGRACLNLQHRNSLALAHLWRGLLLYAEGIKARFLFGCSSLPTTNPQHITQVLHDFATRGYLRTDLALPAQPTYRFPLVPFVEKNTSPSISLPPLLLTYLKVGAQVGIEPALDLSFQCTDFLTILETSRMNMAYSRRLARC